MNGIQTFFAVLFLEYLSANTNSIGFVFVEEEDECKLDSGGDGSCLHVEKCAKAIALISSGGKPKICGFVGKYPMVCCENGSLNLVKEYGLIARQKCSEYQISSISTTTTATTNTNTTTTTMPAAERPFTEGETDFHIVAIGGVAAEPLEFPHMAVLGYGTKDDIHWQCGGSLVSENYVLTAAHCTRSKYGQVQFVKLGVHQLGHTVTHFEETFRVINIVKHPEYLPSEGYHDIALLQLEYPVNIQGIIRPACIHISKELPNETFVATGWGAIELHGDIHDTLQKVILQHVPFDSCTKYYGTDRRLPNGVVEDWQLCADGGGERIDTCHGDSGGPLQVRNPDYSYTIVGITSLGITCAIVPSIYTRISNYVPWIEQTVWGS